MFQVACDNYAEGTLTVPVHEHSVFSGKNAKPCQRCRRTFWAWDTGRDCCYLCAPPDPPETERILGTVYHHRP